MTDQSEVLATLTPSLLRRGVAAGTQAILGLIVLLLAVRIEAGFFERGLIALLGLAALWQAERLWRATGHSLVLTRGALSDDTGRVIAALSDIERVDRGFFAFKPSNGFLIRLKHPAPRGWCPGLWWRFGRSVGVGGATNGRAAREMADLIAFVLQDRQAPPDG